MEDLFTFPEDPSSAGHSSPSSSDNDGHAPVDEHAVMETLFYNEMRMMDFLHPMTEENQNPNALTEHARYLSSALYTTPGMDIPMVDSSDSSSIPGSVEGGVPLRTPWMPSQQHHHQVPRRPPARHLQQRPVQPHHVSSMQPRPGAVVQPPPPLIPPPTSPPPTQVPQHSYPPPPQTFLHHTQPLPQQKPLRLSPQISPQLSPAMSSLPSPPCSPPKGLTPTLLPELPPQQETEGAKQLVSQFASLASQLGIRLPESVLSSLTTVASIREQQNSKDPSSNDRTTKPAEDEPKTSSKPPPSSEDQTPPTNKQPPTDPLKNPTIQLLDQTALAAIESIQSTTSKGQHNPYSNRKRKRPRIEDCNEKLTRLRQENEMLKRHLENISQKTARFDSEREKAEKKMKEVVKDGKETVKEEELRSVLDQFSEMYSDYGRYRNEELSFHLDQLEKLAAPTNFTKMTLWTLNQPTQFFTKPKRNPLSNILMKELKITSFQGKKIIEHREKIRQLVENITTCLSLIKRLKKLCSNKQKMFSDRMKRCQEILTPFQVMKLLIWVNEHEGVLDGICPGWGSERIRTKGGGKDRRREVEVKDEVHVDEEGESEEEEDDDEDKQKLDEGTI